MTLVRSFVPLLLATMLCIAPRAGAAEPVLIKLGTLAPKGSTWETLLKQMGQEWSKQSNGQVTLRIYAGGTLGNEGDMAVGVVKLVHIFFILNVSLAVFNILPIPPLDGIHILESLLPDSYAPAFETINQYGMILLFVVLLTGFLNPIFQVVLPFAEGLIFIGAS